MEKIKKILIGSAFVVALAASLVAGCGKKTENKSSEPKTDPAAECLTNLEGDIAKYQEYMQKYDFSINSQHRDSYQNLLKWMDNAFSRSDCADQKTEEIKQLYRSIVEMAVNDATNCLESRWSEWPAKTHALLELAKIVMDGKSLQGTDQFQSSINSIYKSLKDQLKKRLELEVKEKNVAYDAIYTDLAVFEEITGIDKPDEDAFARSIAQNTLERAISKLRSFNDFVGIASEKSRLYSEDNRKAFEFMIADIAELNSKYNLGKEEAIKQGVNNFLSRFVSYIARLNRTPESLIDKCHELYYTDTSGRYHELNCDAVTGFSILEHVNFVEELEEQLSKIIGVEQKIYTKKVNRILLSSLYADLKEEFRDCKLGDENDNVCSSWLRGVFNDLSSDMEYIAEIEKKLGIPVRAYDIGMSYFMSHIIRFENSKEHSLHGKTEGLSDALDFARENAPKYAPELQKRLDKAKLLH